MINPQDTIMSKTMHSNFVQQGKNLGWKAGFRLSILYAISTFLIVESLDQGIGFLRLAFNLHKFVVTLFQFTAISIATIFVAIVPATILGTLTGIWLGKLAEIANDRMSKYLFTLFCVLSCLAIATLIHLVFQIPIKLSFQLLPSEEKYFIGLYETYPVSIGIPSMIYVLTGGWVGWKLFPKRSIQIDIQE